MGSNIRKGDRFYCQEDVKMFPEGGIAYQRGKVYVSENNGCITDESGDTSHVWTETWTDYFIPAPHPVETCDCRKCKQFEETKDWAAKPDKDYFQSVQEEYGQVNYARDASRPFPNPEDFVISTSYGVNPTPTEQQIIDECESLKNLLIGKNRAYGDSALSRGTLFDISPVEALKARINDKLSRIRNSGLNGQTEDTLQDVMGYMILLRIALKQETDQTVEAYSAMFPGR